MKFLAVFALAAILSHANSKEQAHNDKSQHNVGLHRHNAETQVHQHNLHHDKAKKSDYYTARKIA